MKAVRAKKPVAGPAKAPAVPNKSAAKAKEPAKAAPAKTPPVKAAPAKAPAGKVVAVKAPAAKVAAGKAAPVKATSAKAPAAKVAAAPAAKQAKPVAKPPRVPPKPVASSLLRGTSSSGATSRNADSPALRVGDDIPPFSKGPVTRVDVAKYCGAAGVWNPLSLDEPFAKAVGLPSVVVPGGVGLGVALAAVGRWLRDSGRILRVGARAVKMAWPGDQLTAKARVSEVRTMPGGREVDLDVWVENQKGELVLRGQATCHVTYELGYQGYGPR